MVNKVIIIGNLGRDPELRRTNGGQSVCNFSVATTEKWTDAGGAKQERTEWHNVVVWGKQAELCNQYLGKGSKVYVEGSIATREYDDKDGNKRKAVEIKAQTVRFLSPSSGGSSEAPRANGAAAAEDDDILF